MRSLVLILIALVFVFSSCTNTTEQTLTTNGKDVLSQEVERTIDAMMDGMKNIDVTDAFESNFLLDDDFKYIDINGKVLNKDGFLNEAHSVFDNVEKIDYDFSIPVIRIIDRNVAIVNMAYGGKYYFPGSTVAWPSCVSTLVLNKMDDKWKVIHFHESLQESEIVSTDL